MIYFYVCRFNDGHYYYFYSNQKKLDLYTILFEYLLLLRIHFV